MKNEMKNLKRPNQFVEDFSLFIKQCYRSYYCLNCRRNPDSKNPKIARTKNGRIMLL